MKRKKQASPCAKSPNTGDKRIQQKQTTQPDDYSNSQADLQDYAKVKVDIHKEKLDAAEEESLVNEKVVTEEVGHVSCKSSSDSDKVLVANTLQPDLDSTLVSQGFANEFSANAETRTDRKRVKKDKKRAKKQVEFDLTVLCVPETMAVDVDDMHEALTEDDINEVEDEIHKLSTINENGEDIKDAIENVGDEADMERKTDYTSAKKVNDPNRDKKIRGANVEDTNDSEIADFSLRSALQSPHAAIEIIGSSSSRHSSKGNSDRNLDSGGNESQVDAKNVKKEDHQSDNDSLDFGESSDDEVVDEGSMSQKFGKSKFNVTKSGSRGKLETKGVNSELGRHVFKGGNSDRMTLKEVNAMFETPDKSGKEASYSRPELESPVKKRPLFKAKSVAEHDKILRRSPRKHKSYLAKNVQKSSRQCNESLDKCETVNKNIGNIGTGSIQKMNLADDNETGSQYESYLKDGSVVEVGETERIDNDQHTLDDPDVTIAPDLTETNETCQSQRMFLDVYNVIPVNNGVLNNSRRFQVKADRRKGMKDHIDDDKAAVDCDNSNISDGNKQGMRNKSKLSSGKTLKGKSTNETMRSPSVLSRGSKMFETSGGKNDRSGRKETITVSSASAGSASRKSSPTSDIDSPLILKREVTSSGTGTRRKDNRVIEKNSDDNLGSPAGIRATNTRRSNKTDRYTPSTGESQWSTTSRSLRSSQETKDPSKPSGSKWSRFRVKGQCSKKFSSTKPLHQTTLTQAFFSPKKDSQRSIVELDETIDDEDDICDNDEGSDAELELALRLSLQEAEITDGKSKGPVTDSIINDDDDIEITVPFKKPLKAPLRESALRRKKKLSENKVTSKGHEVESEDGALDKSCVTNLGLNGSLDPAAELSEWCKESETLPSLDIGKYHLKVDIPS